MRLLALLTFWTTAMGAMLPAAAATRAQVETTITMAAAQVAEHYVDVVEPRSLFTHGLRGLGSVAGEPGSSRRRSLDAAMQAEATAIGFKPQADLLIAEIMRFRAGRERDAALAAALRGMMAGLDPHSRLVLPAEMQPPPASVGLELTVKGGALTVVRPLPGGPGERAGLQAGDVLVGIDGRPTTGLPLPEAVALLRGALGTSPVLKVERPGAPAPLTLRPVRGPVQAPPSLRWTLEGRVAVIKISAFDGNTRTNLQSALDAAASRAGGPLEGLVLDMRGNAGGLLDAAEQLGGMMLPAGTEIANLRGRTPANARRLVSRQGDVVSGLPVVMIVDSRTGAGAEIVAGALQDHGRALVVGQKTAGAGTIQTVLPLPEGQGALIVTTARVYRATGAALDGAGVAPDLVLDEESGLLTPRSGNGSKLDAQTESEVAGAVSAAPSGTDTALLAAIKLVGSVGKPATSKAAAP